MTLAQKLHIYYGIPLGIPLFQSVTMYYMSTMVDMNNVLSSQYLYLWPFNIRYVYTMHRLQILDNQVSYVVISCSNTMLILILCMLIRFVLGKRIGTINLKPGLCAKLFGTSAVIFMCFYFFDFANDDKSIWAWSTKRPMVFSCLQISFLMYMMVWALTESIIGMLDRTKIMHVINTLAKLVT